MTDQTTDRTGSARRQRLLLVEDSFLVALALEAVLEEQGFEIVGPFGNVADGVAAAGTEPLDGAVLDYDVGGEAVTPIADLLGRRGVRFLILSGLPAASGPAVAGAAFLRKPVSRAELSEAVGLLFPRNIGPSKS